MFHYIFSEWPDSSEKLRVQPFKCQPREMVIHAQTIRRRKPTNCLSVFDHFVTLALKGLTPQSSISKRAKGYF